MTITMLNDASETVLAETTTPELVSRRAVRSRRAAVAGLVLAIGVVLSACNAGDASTNAADIDRLRASVGVGQLTRVAELDAKAQAQADRMARRGTIFHSANLAAGISAGWSSVGENVAAAGSIQQAQIALEASPSHYRNLTNGSFNQVGIGVAKAKGVVYLVQVFVGR